MSIEIFLFDAKRNPVVAHIRPEKEPRLPRAGIEISSQNPGKYGEKMAHTLSPGSVLKPLSPFHVIPSGQLAAASVELPPYPPGRNLQATPEEQKEWCQWFERPYRPFNCSVT
jgi:hypothetical protein